MSEVFIQPLRSYQDLGAIRSARSEPYQVPLRHAKELEAKGLCAVVGNTDPKGEPGASQSASPAAPASPQKTASKSGNGETKAKRGRQSAPTPPSG